MLKAYLQFVLALEDFTMALTLMSKNGRGALCIIANNGTNPVNFDGDLPTSVPLICDLTCLSRPTLMKMTSCVSDCNLNKMNKSTMANIIQYNWEAITQCFCVENGLISIYGTIEEKTSRDIPPTTSLSIQEFKGDLNTNINRPYFVMLVVPMEGSSLSLRFHFDDKMTGRDIFRTFNEVSR